MDDERLIDFMGRVENSLGRIEAKVDNQDAHILAVSKKVDHRCDGLQAEISVHKENGDAHGQGSRGKTITAFVAWAGLGIAAAKAWVDSHKQ